MKRRVEESDVPEGFHCKYVAERLDRLCRRKGFDYGLKFDIGPGRAWGAELKITTRPSQEDQFDRSFVFFTSGGETPEIVVLQVYNDAMTDLRQLGFIAENDIEPAFMISD